MTGRYRALDDAEVLLVGSTDWFGAAAGALEERTGAVTRTASTAAAGRRAVRDGPVDCVLAEYALEDRPGTWLVEAIREESASLPVLVCTASGSEAAASEVVGAGADDYLAVDGSAVDAVDEVLERTAACLRAASRSDARRERARQFDAIFHDSRTLTWVLDPAGSLVRANEAARALVDAPEEAWVGRPFWAPPWWPSSSGTRDDVRQVVEPATDGELGSAVVTREAAGDGVEVVELSARPVRDEAGEVVSIVVEGVDITERVAVERELRRSEELHRVTLNNMTDTVLIADEAGRYTYVCPNVHFIFGYTAEEIRELGTIDALLGEDLFDREALAEAGVLKNLECTATDKAGREHTLLVNVREVDIQGGTLLFSCRDITKRKQRERALATLQETARDFLYAETAGAIAQHVVDDTADVLDLEAGAVYLFDADRNELQPAAWTAGMERLHGPPAPLATDASSLAGHSFVEGETRFLDDGHEADGLEHRASDLRSAAAIPLGDHGVFVAGDADPGRFDPVIRELADLLAATAEAALERVRRESRLREQERELQQRNQQLTALNRINGIIREIDQALVQAETRGEVDHAVCELLTADDRFSFAWIGGVDPVTEAVEARAWAGAEQGYLDSVELPADGAAAEPAGRTAATREVTIVSNVAEGLREAAWRKEALARDYRSVLSVPLAYGELSYGVLTVYADRQEAFDTLSREVLVELGETIASATSAIERKNALLAPSVTRVEMAAEDPTFVLSRLAAEAGCSVTYQGGVQQTEQGSFVFVTVEGAALDHVESAAHGLVAIDDVHRVSGGGDGGVLRLRLSRPFLALELADHGAVLRRAAADGERTTLVIDVPEGVELRHVSALVTDAVGDVALRSKQTLDRSPSKDFPSRFFDRLTDRQVEVVQTAYYSGFFESPRESTGEDVADTLGISSQAFYQHTRTVQRKLFSMLFDDTGSPSTLPHAG